MINPNHYQELLESAIDPDIIHTAFESVSGGVDLFNALFPEPENGYPRLNTGKLNSQYQRFLDNCERSSGWIVRGVEPTTGQPIDFIRFKPDPGCPLAQVWDSDKQKTKVIKYRSPLGVESRLITLPVTPKIIKRIQKRYPGLILDDITPKTFWQYVISNPKIPIALAEGEKKAASLLSIGVVTIALPGIRMGYRRGNNGLILHRDLELFAQPGRLFIFYFDNDLKPETRRNTENAIAKTARLLLKKKCEVNVVTIPLIDGAKGAIDDYLYKFGTDAFENLKPQSFIRWDFNLEQKNRITRTPNLIVNTPSMGKAIDASIVPRLGLLILDGAKATGKTELLENICRGDDLSILSLGHRIFLQKGLAERLKADYRTDIEVIRHKGTKNYMGSDGNYATRLAGCSEGLIAFYSAIRQYLSSDQRKILVLDEVDQVLISLLTSDTCDRDGNRPLLLSIYEEIIRGSDLIVLASADISDAEINWIQKIRSKGGETAYTPVFYVKNEFIPEGGRYIFVNSKEEVIELAKMSLESRDNIWFICDTLELSKEVFNTFNKLITEGEKGLLINSDTSDKPEQEQFIKAIADQKNPDQVSQFLKPYRFVVVTQSLWTSASITVDHFGQVYACFSAGLNGDWDMAQSLERIRKPVPRTIYCVEKGKPNKDFSGFYKNHIKETLRLATEINIRTIATRLTTGIDPIINYQWNWDDSPHIDLYCHYVARENCSKFNLRERLEARLIYEGKEVIHDSFIDTEKLEVAKAKSKEQRKINKAKETEEQLFNTPRLSDEQAKDLSHKPKLTSEQDKQLKLYYFIKFYQLHDYYEELETTSDREKTIEIQEYIRLTWEKDDRGRLRDSIQRLEATLSDGTMGIDRAIGTDVKSWNRQAKHGKGVFAPDLRRKTSQVWALSSLLNFKKYLVPDQIWDEESLQPLLSDCNRIKRRELSAALDMNIPEKLEGTTGALWLFSKTMWQLAIKTKRQRKGREQKGTISIDPYHWVWLQSVLERRSKVVVEPNLSDYVVMSPFNNDVMGDYTTSPESPNNDPITEKEDITTSPTFEELGGTILVEAETGRPDIVTKRTHLTHWETLKKAYVSRHDLKIQAYRLPTIEDVANWIREAISTRSKKQVEWLSKNFGGDGNCLMAQAIHDNLDEFSPIYDLMNG